MESEWTGGSAYVSGAQRFLARSLFIFFSKPLLFLLPALVVTSIGGYLATTTPDEYQSIGVLSVSSETFLDVLTGSRSNTLSYESPAVTTARQFNELIQTDGFATSVIDGAGLGDERAAGLFTVADFRQNTYASASGESLVDIIAIADDPERARLLAVSSISAFKNYIISSEVLGTDVAENFYDEQLTTYKADVDLARQNLQDFLAANPEPINPGDARDIGEQLEITRLNDLLTQAQVRFDSAFDNREAARLATLQSSADINQRFRTLDEPVAPDVPQSGLKTLATTMILYAILGLLLSIGAVALATVLDRSIHSANDLERLGAGVRAVVPRSAGMSVDAPRHVSAGSVKTKAPEKAKASEKSKVPATAGSKNVR